jgi:hypothetical protein
MPLEAVADSSLESQITQAIRAELTKVCEENQRILAAIEEYRLDAAGDSMSNGRLLAAEEALQRLATLQIESVEDKGKRSKAVTRLIVLLVAFVTSGGGLGLWSLLRQPSDDEIRKEAEPVIQAVGTSSETIENRLDSAEEKINKLGHAVVEQQVQISDGFEFIADKIDAAHPRQKDAVDIGDYPTVEAAKRKADAIKMKKGVQKLFDEEDVFDGQ